MQNWRHMVVSFYLEKRAQRYVEAYITKIYMLYAAVTWKHAYCLLISGIKEAACVYSVDEKELWMFLIAFSS